MNIVTYNVRGCGSLIKRRRIYQLLQKSKVDLCFIQELNWKHHNDDIVVSLYRNTFFEWFASGA